MASLSHGAHYLEALSVNTLVLVRHLATYNTYVLLFNVGTEEDTVDLARVAFLNEPMTVYESSVFSRRRTGYVVFSC